MRERVGRRQDARERGTRRGTGAGEGASASHLCVEAGRKARKRLGRGERYWVGRLRIGPWLRLHFLNSHECTPTHIPRLSPSQTRPDPHSPLSTPPPPRAAVEQRLADWTMTPIWGGESLQVLRYRKDQKYDSHVSLPCCVCGGVCARTDITSMCARAWHDVCWALGR